MKAIMLILTVMMVFMEYGFSQAKSLPDSAIYLGQIPPGDIPKVFAPGIVSLPNKEEKIITFSPEGNVIFYISGSYPDCRIMFMEYKNGNWSKPETASFSKNRLCDEPFFSLDGKRVYFWTSINGEDDICFSEKKDAIWGDPVSLGNPLNLSQGQYHPCIVNDNSIYFASSNGDICRSQYKNGKYEERVILQSPINNIPELTETWKNPYVSPDESYLIFQSSRNGGYGKADLYISFKKTDGTWTTPKNLGEKINTSDNDADADITKDGKYMTFSRKGDIYWVSSDFIEIMKKNK